MGNVKKMVMVMIAALLIAAASLAETEIPAGLEGQIGFEISEDGSFLYQREAEQLYTDGRVVFGLEASTYAKDGTVLVCVYTRLLGADGGSLAAITKFDVVIGEREWSWHSPITAQSGSLAFLGLPETDFLQALAEADKVYVRVHFLSKHMLAEFTGKMLEPVREAAGMILSCSVLDMVDDSADGMTAAYEAEHPVHRSGKAAQAGPAKESSESK